jgi:hypothetical protein
MRVYLIHLSAPILWSLCAFGTLSAAEPPGAPGAGTAKPALPKGPLLAKPPEFASWVVVHQYADPRKAAPKKAEGQATGAAGEAAGAGFEMARPKQVTFVKTRNILRVETQDELGQTWNRWCQGDSHLVVLPRGKGVVGCEGQDHFNPYYEDYESSPFPGFQWISAENFAGIESVQSRHCLVFRGEVPGLDLLSPGDANLLRSMLAEGLPVEDRIPGKKPAVAMVDLETRLPVALEVAGESRQYTFLAPPGVLLSFPKEVQAHFAAREAAWKWATRPVLAP